MIYLLRIELWVVLTHTVKIYLKVLHTSKSNIFLLIITIKEKKVFDRGVGITDD